MDEQTHCELHKLAKNLAIDYPSLQIDLSILGIDSLLTTLFSVGYYLFCTVGSVCTRIASDFQHFIGRGSVVTKLYSSFKHGV